MSELTVFSYDSAEIRTVTVEGVPYWVAKDVAAVLDYKDTNNAAKLHCRGVAKYHPIVDALGRKQEARIIGESDLYRLIANSKLPSAEKFEAWIFEEVLPAISKTGSYSAPKKIQVQTASDLFQMDKGYRALLRTAKAIGLKGNFAALSANQAARKIFGIDVMQVLQIENLQTSPQEQPFTPTELGELAGLSAQATNKLLIDQGFQVKAGKIYTPTSKGEPFARLVDTDKKHHSGAPVTQLKWTKAILDSIKTADMAIN